MSTDGTTNGGAKPPRTLFSLGRPGPKSTTTEPPAEPSAAPIDESPAEDVAVELACGACGTTLIPGAAFCGECGTPVAHLDDEPLDLVEEVPMGDLEDPDFGEYVEELPIDDAPAVLYADAEAAPVVEPTAEAGDDDGVGTTVMAQPAAVLYADPTQAEPLPPVPPGSFEISEPVYGTADGTIVEPDAGADATSDADVVPAGADVPAATAAEVAAVTGADEPEAGSDEDADGAPLAAGAAVAGAAVIGTAAAAGAAEAGAAATDEEVLAGLASTTDVGSSATDAPTDLPGEAPADGPHLPWSDAPAAATAAEATTVQPSVDDPTTVAPAAAAVPVAGVAASSAAGTPGTPVAATTYGAAPPPSGGGSSKTGLLVGVAAAVVLVLIVGGIIIATSGGDKDGDVQTAQSTTTLLPSSTTTASSSTTQATTTTTADVTSTSEATTTLPSTETTAATVTTIPSSQVPTTPRVTVTQPPPTTVIQPGRIVANPPSGAAVSIPKGGSTTIRLDNVGGSAASCALTGSNGITVSQDCSPSIPPGGAVFVTVQANPTWEGPATVTGVLEGAGSYLLTVNVQNR